MGETRKQGGHRPRRGQAEMGLHEESDGFLVFLPAPVPQLSRGREVADRESAGQSLLTPGGPGAAATAPPAGQPSGVRSVLYLGHRADTVDPLRHVFRHATWRARRAHIDAVVRTDLAASLADVESKADASFDAVWVCRVLQHFEASQVPRALGEFRRILKPGGCVVVLVPDLQAVAALIVADRLEEAITLANGRSVAAIDLVYGPRALVKSGEGAMVHRTGFTATTVAAALAAAGFERVRTRRRGLDLWAIGHRPSAASDGPGA